MYPLYTSDDYSSSSASSCNDMFPSDSSNASASSSSSSSFGGRLFSDIDMSDDDSSISSSSSDESEDTMDRFMEGFFDEEAMEFDADGSSDDYVEGETSQRRERRANQFGYFFGNFMDCNYYRQFLCPEVREKTYTLSNRSDSRFRSHFRVPLTIVDDITTMFIERGWVQPTKRVKDRHRLYVRTQLFILCALEHLGNRKPFRQFPTETNMSESEHRKFQRLFVERMYEIRDEHVYYPRTFAELEPILAEYQSKDLPGAGGSIDVVHVKWSTCPAGDFNKCKGKESFPSLACQCISNHGRRILGIAPVQYGARSDKHIVRLDPIVHLIKNAWYKEVEWTHFDITGESKTSKGVYLICDGGYLRWKTLICPYRGAPEHGRRGYFNTNLESIRKDVECTFGILKKRWRILDYGIHYTDMAYCEQIFVVCAMLHNMMVDSLETRLSTIQVGRGRPIGDDGMYIEGEASLEERCEGEYVPAAIRKKDREEAVEWSARRDHLAEHREFCKSLRGRGGY